MKNKTRDQKLKDIERKFSARADKVPLNRNLFQDPVIRRLMKQHDKLIRG